MRIVNSESKINQIRKAAYIAEAVKSTKNFFDLRETSTSKRTTTTDLVSPSDWKYQNNNAQTKRETKNMEIHKAKK